MATSQRPAVARARGSLLPPHLVGQLWRAAGYAGIALALVVVCLPLYWMLTAAVKTNREIYTLPPNWIPLAPTLQNFADAWNAAPFGRFYANSIVLTVVGSAAKMLNAVFSAYAFAFLRFPKREVIFVIVLAALMIPEEATILPNYLTMANFGWVNTFPGLLLPGFVSAFGTFLLRQHFLGLPREVLDAARVDGAGHLRMLRSIILPMSRPVLATLLLLTVVNRWNDFLWPLIITNTSDMRTLPIGIYFLFSQEGNTVWGVVMAGTLFVVLPLLLLFLAVQRHIVSGIAAGAVKG